MHEIKTVGLVGAGVIGAGWAARYLGHGLDVIAADPSPGAKERLRAEVDNVWPVLQKLGLMPNADRARLRFTDDLAEVCRTAHFIQESAPEQEAQQRALYREMDALAPSEVVIASSWSGLPLSQIQPNCRYPGRIIIGQPCKPVYLLPLVEVVGGENTSEAALEGAMAFYRWAGMRPIRAGQENSGFIAERLQQALWRETLNLVNDGIATIEDIDEAIIYGPGLRWAIMGTGLAFHLADGDAGMPPPPARPRQRGPELTEGLIDRLAVRTKEQVAGKNMEEWKRLRDDCLVSIMHSLSHHNHASGQIIAELEAKSYTSYAHTRWTPTAKIGQPLKLYDCPVDYNWLDYNGHMSESSYLTAFGYASDALFRYTGIDEDYRAAGNSFYTVETHINYYREVGGGESLRFSTQLLGLDEKRLHFFHSMYRGSNDELLCTTEQMLVHVDMNAAAACPIKPEVYQALSAIMEAHQDMPIPKQVGRQMAIKPKK